MRNMPKQMSPLEIYQSDVLQNELTPDTAQRLAVEALDRLWHDVSRGSHKTSNSLWPSWLSFRRFGPSVKGVYLWGGVGRGKTYLMDLFFDALPLERKLRTHFHRFMRSIHQSLTDHAGAKNPLDIIARDLAKRYKVICFDEFFVTDITDAMILGNLFQALFAQGSILVATSNIEPENLYANGLQRERFLPAIQLIRQHSEIVNVDGGVDYRLRSLTQAHLYYTPIDEHTESALQQCFTSLAPDRRHMIRDIEVEIEGRHISAKIEADDVVWFDFLALCDGPRSQRDYVVLAREYHAIVVSGVPVFQGQNDDQARRFIYLVDELYDRKVKLVLSAEAPISGLYVSGRLAFEFERTQSRLLEMQSEDYLAMAHKPV